MSLKLFRFNPTQWDYNLVRIYIQIYKRNNKRPLPTRTGDTRQKLVDKYNYILNWQMYLFRKQFNHPMSNI